MSDTAIIDRRRRVDARTRRPALHIDTLPTHDAGTNVATQDKMVEFFKLLADPTRMQVLFALGRRPEMNVRSICDLVGQSQPAVSHHLALLRKAGLIDRRKEGKHNFYRLVPHWCEDVLALVAERM